MKEKRTKDGKAERAYDRHVREFLRSLKKAYLSAVRVNLLQDRAYVIHSVDFKEKVGQEVVWTEYLNFYTKYVNAEDVHAFNPYYLWKCLQSGQTFFSKDISYILNGSLQWITMEAYMDEENGKPYAMVTVRKSTRDHLEKNIIGRYVQNKRVQFVYLDVKNNSYETFGCMADEVRLFPQKSDDYAGEIAKYVENYVAEEDKENVLYGMSLKNVLQQLEKVKVYSLSCGVIDPMYGYVRRMMEFQYYDRETQMILLSRTDITSIYMAQKEERDILWEALERARTDSLTKILNHSSIVDEITLCLDKHPEEQSAVMFIDMDDFKNINDSLGHIKGDELLIKTAKILTKNVQEDDLVGRIGGDEFVVFLRNVGSLEKAEAIGREICRQIHRLSIDLCFPVSCSIGIAISPEDGQDYLTLTDSATNGYTLQRRKAKTRFPQTGAEERRPTKERKRKRMRKRILL